MLKRFITILTLIISLFATVFVTDVHAAENKIEIDYSNVLDDLKSDSKFIESNYDVNSNEIKLITIYESEFEELYLYVFQPNSFKNILLSSVTLSNDLMQNLMTPSLFTYNSYSLELVSNEANFYKYKVLDYKPLLNRDERYYTISKLSYVVKEISSVIIPGKKPIVFNNYDVEINRCYGFRKNGEKVVKDISEIEVTHKYTGHNRYRTKWGYFENDYTDSWWIAFNTDRPIDTLISVDVKYLSRKYSEKYELGNSLIPIQKENEYGKYEQVWCRYSMTSMGSSEGKGWFAKTYEWKRIEKISDFLSDSINEMSVDVQTKLIQIDQAYGSSQNGWIIRFLETPYKREVTQLLDPMNPFIPEGALYSVCKEEGIQVADVLIFRLGFMTDGEFYSLDVKDIPQNPDKDPDNENTDESKITDVVDKIGDVFSNAVENVKDKYKEGKKFFNDILPDDIEEENVFSRMVKLVKIILSVLLISIIIVVIIKIVTFIRTWIKLGKIK